VLDEVLSSISSMPPSGTLRSPAPPVIHAVTSRNRLRSPLQWCLVNSVTRSMAITCKSEQRAIEYDPFIPASREVYQKREIHFL
jgi:hypothetical protein